jgi:hypothetical protein
MRVPLGCIDLRDGSPVPTYTSRSWWDVLVVSIHNPARELERGQLIGLDISSMKLKKNDDLWLLDIVFYFLKKCLGKPLMVGGDFNCSRLLDDLYGESGNHEFFDRIHSESFVSLHRKFHDTDQQTFFQKRGKGHQLDYLYSNRSVGDGVSSYKVWDYDEVRGLSDHAPLVAELDSIPGAHSTVAHRQVEIVPLSGD